jgi:hypothetical protein
MKSQDKNSCHKVRHRSELAASKHVAALERGQRQNLFTYFCPTCSAWHVGHSANRGVFVPKIDRIFDALDGARNDPQEPKPTYWWLAFSRRRRGGYNVREQLGVIIVCASTCREAVRRIRDLGIHPGGGVRGSIIPGEHVPDVRFHNRLLSKADLNEMEPNEYY